MITYDHHMNFFISCIIILAITNRQKNVFVVVCDCALAQVVLTILGHVECSRASVLNNFVFLRVSRYIRFGCASIFYSRICARVKMRFVRAQHHRRTCILRNGENEQKKMCIDKFNPFFYILVNYLN